MNIWDYNFRPKVKREATKLEAATKCQSPTKVPRSATITKWVMKKDAVDKSITLFYVDKMGASLILNKKIVIVSFFRRYINVSIY